MHFHYANMSVLVYLPSMGNSINIFFLGGVSVSDFQGEYVSSPIPNHSLKAENK